MPVRNQAGHFIHPVQSLRMGIAAVVNQLGKVSMISVSKVNNVKLYRLASSFMP